MAAPPAYLDECIDYNIVALLQRRGFNVRHVYDERTTNYDDEQQLAHATRHGWVFVTHNQREFHRRHNAWLQRGSRHAGILGCPQHSDPVVVELRVAMLLDWLGVKPRAAPFLVKWGELQKLLEQNYRVNMMYSESEVRRVLGWPPLGTP
jgi:hypothetical protein